MSKRNRERRHDKGKELETENIEKQKKRNGEDERKRE